MRNFFKDSPYAVHPDLWIQEIDLFFALVFFFRFPSDAVPFGVKTDAYRWRLGDQELRIFVVGQIFYSVKIDL